MTGRSKQNRRTSLPAAARAADRLAAAALAALALLIAATTLASGSAGPAAAPAPQDWIRTGIGLGVQQARLAVADFAPRTAASDRVSRVFTEVLWADLDYSGIVEMVSKSFYPLEMPSTPQQLKHSEWAEPPVLAHMLAFGNLELRGSELVLEGWLNDVRNPLAAPALAKRYRQPLEPGADARRQEQEARRLAHQFADEIIALLSGGLPGIGSTQIAFVSNRSGFKELWVMDYDGANQRQVSTLRSIALTPRWSPDGSRIAFTCYRRHGGVTSAQICIHSMETGRPMAFAAYRGTNSAPAWSPDGTRIVFMSSMHGDPELFISDSTGMNLRRLTYSAGADTSPVWNPRTGEQIAFVSDRAGIPHLYIMNADGTNVERVSFEDRGYVIDPAWSPNGQLLAFSWRRPEGNFDIYIMDIASREVLQLTRDSGRNERPSWAPDGRHIVFESTRTGTRQIWTMLADGTRQRQLTFDGHNESPSWSPR
jgi:TolB protein